MSEVIKLLDGPYRGSEVVITGPDERYVRIGYVIWHDDMPGSPVAGRLYKVTHAKDAYKPWGARESGWKFNRNMR